MKTQLQKISFAILLTLAPFLASAQIPNGDFENWTAGEPDNWMTSNSAPYVPITQTTPGHAGSSAIKIANASIGTNVVSGFVSQNYASSTAYAYLHGWYKSSLSGADQGIISALNAFDTTAYAAGSQLINTSTAVFQQFEAYMSASGGIIDSQFISFTLNPAFGGNVASFIIIDDLSWSNTPLTGINNPSSQPLTLESPVPNPAHGMIDIIYHLPEVADVTMKIFDLSGKEISTILNLQQQPGTFKAQFDASSLAAGIYVCRLEANGITRLVKLVVG